MQIILKGAQSYAAKIMGLHPKYKYQRQILREKNGSKKWVEEKTYELDPGLYELRELDQARFLAVLNDRAVELAPADVERVRLACEKCRLSLPELFDTWAASKRRTSATFAAKVSTALVRYEERADIRIQEEKADRKKATAERKEAVQSMTTRQAFDSSSGPHTTMFMTRLRKTGTQGEIAAQLFRVQKSSTRAKLYRGDFKGVAYDRKGECLDMLCEMLSQQSDIRWGWRKDPSQTYAPWVLYVDLPQGQVSFHSPSRRNGPDYPRRWDGRHANVPRIIAFCDTVLGIGSRETAN